MCGIAGIISPDSGQVSRQQLKKMTDAIAHRGPEGEDFWTNSNNTAGLGHRRLSIIDLSSAASQPMHYLDRYTIVFNGEIYNYIEIRKDLQRKGYTFSSESDTEVILAAYACWKEECLQYFDGMFAFAIWDEEEKSLFAARDRFGEKPFYYLLDELSNTLWFASEMKALYAAGIDKNVNEKMMLLFLTQGFTDSAADPSITFDKHIQQLPPAHYMKFRLSGGTIIKSYWELNKDVQATVSTEDAVIRFAKLFTDSVEKRFRSDVPVGTSLSGGLDSSAIAAVASGIRSGSNSYKCFSAIFPGFGKDESRFSQLVAQQCKLQRFVTMPSADDLAADLQQFLHYHDEPVGSASVYAQYKVYRLAKQHGVTVLLDGQGADEVLAGYHRYLHWYLQELVRKEPGSLRAALKKLRNNRVELVWGWKNYAAAWFPHQTASRLKQRVVNSIQANKDIDPEYRRAYFDESLVYKPVVNSLNDILHFTTCRSGLQELLRYADRNSMAHGREVRLPFLSHELVTYCFSLSGGYKIRDGYTKWVLRKSMGRMLPQEIVWRTDKVAFEPPQRNWMEDNRVQELIRTAKKKLVDQHVLKPSVLYRKIQPQDSLAAENADWWYLSAGPGPA
jgi:asparagine synthase (glutamine-hydrolysing)